MRTLYEINADILAAVDQETGEILDTDRLDALQMERDQKFEGVGLWIKDMNAEITARKEEIKKQQDQVKALENRIASCKEWLRLNLAGEKFKTARVSVSYTHNSRLDVIDEQSVVNYIQTHYQDPEEFLKFSMPEIRKDALKAEIKKGAEIPGASLEPTESVVIK